MNINRRPFKLFFVVVMFLPFMSSCKASEYKSYTFKYWNECAALNSLKTFVQDVTNPNNANYVKPIDRVATFDMDGTLFGERSKIYLEWMFYVDYLNNNPSKGSAGFEYTEYNKTKGASEKHKITLDEVKGNIEKFMENREMPTESGDYKIDLEMREAVAGAILFSGITVEQYARLVDEFLEKDAYSFTNLKFKDMFYKPMIEVVEFLQLNNFDVYVVSGTDRFMVRDIISKHLTIPRNKVIGMDVGLYYNEQDKQVYRGDDLKYKNVKSVKVELIVQEICKKPILSFGNSSGDIQMHNYALYGNDYKSQAYMVVADDNDREFGYSDEIIHERKKDWNSLGFNIFSMKDDFKIIYGDNVAKK